MSKRKDFINAIIDKTDFSQEQAELAMDAVFQVAEETLLDTGEVSIGQMGKIKKVKRAARKGRNPKTGEEIEIPEKVATKYTQSKTIKEKLNS